MRANLNDTLKAAGLPGWVTAELIAETKQIWQEHYGRTLTDHEAIEILLNVDSLFDVLGESDGEAVSGFGEGF